jgi:molybdopterin synthase catalytic subunit
MITGWLPVMKSHCCRRWLEVELATLTTAPLDLASLVASVSDSSYGAIASFVGVVRDHHGGRSVIELEYSAYQPMAERIIASIVAEVEARWPVRAAVRHRIGLLAIGEAAVAVVVASGHRDEAFTACRFVIEAVKSRVPIWKRERYADGTEAWVDPTAPGGMTEPTVGTDR